MSDTIAAAKLRAFLERIERLQEERKTIADDIAEVFKELEGDGFDKIAAKAVLKIRAAEDGLAVWQERSAVLDLYLGALGMLPAPAPARTREIIEEFPVSSRSADRAASGGKPSIPSPEDGGAKMDELQAHPDRAAQADTSSANSGQAATVSHSSALPTVQADNAGEVPPRPASPAAIPDADVPAFLLKERPSLRPLCQDPTNCAGYGNKTCHRCLQAAGQSEAA